MSNLFSILLFAALATSAVSCDQPTFISNSNDHMHVPKEKIVIGTKKLPGTKNPLVLRTDFSDDSSWETICVEILTPDPEFGFYPNLVFANDTLFHDFSEEELLSDSASAYNHAFIFIVDKVTVTHPEHPILCIGLQHDRGKKFRVIPSQMWGVENNLSISNMDFEEFSTAVDSDGIFRGFRKPDHPIMYQ